MDSQTVYSNSELINNLGQSFFLTQILDTRIFCQQKEIGRLSDVIIKENDKLPEVTHLLVARPFGRTDLIVPWGQVRSLAAQQINVAVADTEFYKKNLQPEMILLKDYVLDKKVLDTEDKEVEVVYDIKMRLVGGRLYVTDVDISRYGFLSRMHLKWLANLWHRFQESFDREIISWTYIQHLPEDLSSFTGNVKLKVLKEHLKEIDPVDLADILEELDSKQRTTLFGELETALASDTLEEIEPNVQRELVASLKKERVAQLINEMTPAQAADVLSALPSERVDQIFPLLEKVNADKIKAILQEQETKIVNLSTFDYIQFNKSVTVAQVEEQFPKVSKNKDVVKYIYVTEAGSKLLGVASLKDILLADDSLTLQEIMDKNVISLKPNNTLKESYRVFKHYGLQALPITDQSDNILGVVLYRDVVELKHKFVE